MSRFAWLAACASLIALIFLALAWELVLAPVRPGGSWLVLKALPLLAPLRGVLHRRRHTFVWSSLLILAYFTEGVVRAWSDRGPSVPLAAAEIVLSLAYFGSVLWFLRSSRAG